jgi:hypothetical protein
MRQDYALTRPTEKLVNQSPAVLLALPQQLALPLVLRPALASDESVV